MSDTKHVLFVCTGNTCRSPMAEGLMRKAIGERKDFKVSSAGVAAFPGSAASTETEQILDKLGAKLDGFQSQPVTSELLNNVSHVFTMTESHLATLMSQFPDHEDKYYLLREFSGIKDKREGTCPTPSAWACPPTRKSPRLSRPRFPISSRMWMRVSKLKCLQAQTMPNFILPSSEIMS